MNQAKAQTVASLLIGLGFAVQVVHVGAAYEVRVSSDTPIDSAVVASFATTNAVTGSVLNVSFT